MRDSRKLPCLSYLNRNKDVWLWWWWGSQVLKLSHVVSGLGLPLQMEPLSMFFVNGKTEPAIHSQTFLRLCLLELLLGDMLDPHVLIVD